MNLMKAEFADGGRILAAAGPRTLMPRALAYSPAVPGLWSRASVGEHQRPGDGRLGAGGRRDHLS